MQNHSDQINQLNRQLQVLQGQSKEKIEEMKRIHNASPRELPEEDIRRVENDLKGAETELLNLKEDLSGLESKLSEANEVYEQSNRVAKTHFNRWIDQYMPHLSNQEFFIDAFIRENKNFLYTLIEQPDPYGDNSPRIDPACSYVKQYNQSCDARVHGQVNQAADPIFHLNEHKALESIRSSISQCQSESAVVELFQGYLVYGLGNEEHMNAVLAMANYFFSNKSRVANQNDTDMNARLGHFLHYIQANDAGQYNFSEEIPGNGWFTSNFKTCFENLSQCRIMLISNKWEEFGQLEALCRAVSVQKDLMKDPQRQVKACQSEVSEKQQAIDELQKGLELKKKYNQLYSEWRSIDSQIGELNNQISNLSNDSGEIKHAQSGPPSPRANRDGSSITAPASVFASPPVVNKKLSNLCDQVKTHYQSIKKNESESKSDLWMTKESIEHRINAADMEIKRIDFEKTSSEVDFVNKYAKFGLGNIFTMKRFSYFLKMRYRHEKFLKENNVPGMGEKDPSEIYKKLMHNFLRNPQELVGWKQDNLFDGFEIEGVDKSMKEDLNDYFKSLKNSSLFLRSFGCNKSKDFSKALHIQDRLQLLSQYLAKSPEERIHFCSSFQATDECKMRGERKGRFLRILSVKCLETLKKNNPNRQGDIDEIIRHLDGLPVSSVEKVYQAVQDILANKRHKVQWDSHFWQLSRRRQEHQLEQDLQSLQELVLKANQPLNASSNAL